jgi:hypothetical protein
LQSTSRCRRTRVSVDLFGSYSPGFREAAIHVAGVPAEGNVVVKRASLSPDSVHGVLVENVAPSGVTLSRNRVIGVLGTIILRRGAGVRFESAEHGVLGLGSG